MRYCHCLARYGLALATLLMLTAARAGGQSADATHAAAFDRLDRTARTLIWTVQCAGRAAYLRSTGRFGPRDSVGTRGMCVRQDGRVLGVFFTPDSTFTTATAFRAVHLTNGAPYLGTVDTTAVLNEALAMSAALKKGFPAFSDADRQFAPLSFRGDGDSIQVWLLPAERFMSETPSAVGGERGYVFAPDGRTLAREVDAFGRRRPIAIPDTGQMELVNRDDDVPLLSEMLVATALHRRGRTARLVTRAHVSQLVGPEPNSMWVHVRR
jgi:hypothetical protein